ncbi:MAG: enoyl-CoA hydratase/isomerase family protein [Deltaproteobacteria bacterium]|nr:enoyl-CoA hydratase/isomerase family protein [Deltaproteobacteria bacterium]
MPGRILSQLEAPLAWITIDHPERRNAVSAHMWAELADAAVKLDADPAVRVIVLRGSGEVAFISGADISEFESRRTGGAAAQVYEDGTQRAFGALGAVSKPVIAMIHGFCVGGGVATALAADLRYCADDAVFAIPAARLGLGYHASGIEALTQLVGPSTAREIFFTARRYRAEDALRLGLVNAVFPKAELEARVREIAAQIAANAPLTVRSVKRISRELARDPGQRDREAIRASIQECFDSEDYKEGVRAFLEKRPPKFEGH